MNQRIFCVAMVSIFFTYTFTACKKGGEEIKPYTIPTTYDAFTDVENEDAKASIYLWQGFQSYLGKSNVKQLSQDTVNMLWNNTGKAYTADNVTNYPFTADQLNNLTFSISTLTTDGNTIKVLADSMVRISQYYKTPGAQGIPGKQGTRLVNATGLEYNQAVAKGLMGAFAMYKISQHLSNSKTANNKTVITGKGTAMQHEWDLALGYVGIPKNYNSDTAYKYASTDVNRPLAIGGYFGERGKFIFAGKNIYDAFLKGRAAIGANDYAKRDEAVKTINEYIEKTIASAFYYYVTSPQGTATVDSKLHALSEGYGFCVALKYRPSGSLLTIANYNLLSAIMNTNFYELLNSTTPFEKLKQAQTILTSTYGQLQPN